MSARLASIVLAAAAVISCYLMLLIGHLLPNFFAALYRIEAASDLAVLMPPITKFAARYAWVFAFAIALVVAVIVMLLQRYPTRVLRLLTLGLSAQALVVWFAMFCYFYDEFQGPVSLHHGQRFAFEQFFRSDFGVFPATLCAILIPAIFALLLTERLEPKRDE